MTFLVGHGDLSLEVARADGIVLYAHTRNQNAKTVWRQRASRSKHRLRPDFLKELARQLSLDMQTDNQFVRDLLYRCCIGLACQLT